MTYAMPSLMLLVVEVMAVLSRPVCSFNTDDREVRSPDNTAVFTWRQICRELEEMIPSLTIEKQTFSNPSGLCTDPINVVMVELSSFKP